MTQDEIIRMAREAGALEVSYNAYRQQTEYSLFGDELKRFAALVAAHEREACAKVCDDYNDNSCANYADLCAAAIRARGEK